MFKIIFSIVSVIILTIGVKAQNGDRTQLELEKLHRELDNPLAKRWSLVFQENYAINSRDAVDGNVVSNTFFFQPVIPSSS